MRIRIISFMSNAFEAETANIDINIDMPDNVEVFEQLFYMMKDEHLFYLMCACHEREKESFGVESDYDEPMLAYIAFRTCLINKAIEAKKHNEIDHYIVLQNPEYRYKEFS